MGELTQEHGLALLRQMVRVRRFEERCVQLHTQGRIHGLLHLYIGEEAIAVGVMTALSDEDPVFGTYREHGHALVRGVDPGLIMAELYGHLEGSRRGGSMYLFDATRAFYGGDTLVGGHLPMAVGMALGDRVRGRDRVTACFFGAGAASEGEFHESLHLAALWRCPVLFCCENNHYIAEKEEGRPGEPGDIAASVASHHIPSEKVDGMDVVAVERAARRAVAAIHGGGGPYFLELETYRFRAHSALEPRRYLEETERAYWKAHDPIKGFTAMLRERGWLDADTLSALERETAEMIDAAVAFAEADASERGAAVSPVG